MKEALQTYGYPISDDKKPESVMTRVLQVFQMHFRPSNYQGKLDSETAAIVFNLVCKYFPESQAAFNIHRYLKTLSNPNSFLGFKNTDVQAPEEPFTSTKLTR